MKFDEIPGHGEVKTILRGMVKNKRIPHALLFHGEEGNGNLPMAFTFAQFIFCEKRSNEDSCGECRQCLRLKKLEHPDLHLVFPFSLSKNTRTCDPLASDFRKAFLHQPFLDLSDWFNELGAENKQPVIPAEESDQIIRKLSYTSFENNYKIMVIWMPEKMNQASANKLLKILEEPPDETLFFLVTSHLDQLLTTIISRTQLIKFSPLQNEEMKVALQQKFSIPQDRATQVAALSDGNLRTALRILSEDGGTVAYFQQFQTMMRYCHRYDIFRISQWVDELAATGREQQKYFFQYALNLLRDCLLLNYGSESLVHTQGEELAFLKKFAPFVHERNFEKMSEELNLACHHIERNAHAKILLLDLSLKINELLNTPKPQ
jgi:DNA polymerase III subunit delta'